MSVSDSTLSSVIQSERAARDARVLEEQLPPRASKVRRNGGLTEEGNRLSRDIDEQSRLTVPSVSVGYSELRS